MPRSFNLKAVRGRVELPRDPRLIVQIVLGVLLLANGGALLYLFAPWKDSPAQIAQQIAAARQELTQKQRGLLRQKVLTAKVEGGRVAEDAFQANYFLERRTAFSTILQELNRQAKASSMLSKDQSYTLQPIEGSDNLSIMTMTARFEGLYKDLLTLVNGLDRSPKFLVIESLSASPQQTGRLLDVVMKIDVGVRGTAEVEQP